MNNIRKYLNISLHILAGGSFVIMTLLTCWQVFTRYILGRPSSWSEELVSYLFAWMALLGASLVVGERGHMNIPLLVEKSGPSARRALEILAEIVAVMFAGVILVYGGIQITDLAMAQMTSALGVPVGVFYIVLPLSGVLNIIYCILNIVEIIRNPKDSAKIGQDVEELPAARALEVSGGEQGPGNMTAIQEQKPGPHERR